jgi:disulfide oxidoreductase YuzD
MKTAPPILKLQKIEKSIIKKEAKNFPSFEDFFYNIQFNHNFINNITEQYRDQKKQKKQYKTLKEKKQEYPYILEESENIAKGWLEIKKTPEKARESIFFRKLEKEYNETKYKLAKVSHTLKTLYDDAMPYFFTIQQTTDDFKNLCKTLYKSQNTKCNFK